jgi:3-phenylpropionate/cinnamic acid dioxygenase small subunit
VTGAVTAIHALLAAYAERMDDGDFDAVGELFRSATLRNGTDPERVVARGRDEIASLLHGTIRIYDGKPLEQHVTANTIVEVDDAAGTATARSVFVVYMATPDFPLQATGAGRYHDRFERVDGEWRFVDRLFLQDLRGDLSAHAKQPA